MRTPSLLTTVLIVLNVLVLLPVCVAKEVPSIPRHTVGFPMYENESVIELLKELAQLYSAISTLNGKESPDVGSKALSDLSNSGVIDPRLATAIQSYLENNESKALGVLDEDLRSLIMNAYGAGSRDAVESTLAILRSMYENGSIDVTQYIAALALLEMLASRNGWKDIADSVDKEIKSVATSALSREASKLVDMLSSTNIEAISKALSNSSLDTLLNIIQNPQIRSTAQEVVEKYREGRLSDSDVMRLLDLADRLRSEGILSESEYLAVLEIARRISGHSTVSQQIYPKLVEELQNYASRALQGFSAFSSVARPSLPSLMLPQIPSLPSIQIPQVVSLMMIVCIAIGFTVLLIVLARLFPRIVDTIRRHVIASGILRSISSTLPKERVPRAVELYWQAVSKVARVTGISRESSETHREYLRRVHQRLGAKSTLFERITQIYEIVRFGGAHDPSMDREAERIVREL